MEPSIAGRLTPCRRCSIEIVDGPAIATLIFLVVVYATYGIVTRLGRYAMRTESAHLLTTHLVHWGYPATEWQGYCERQRSELWNGILRPSFRYLAPLLVLTVGLAWIAELRAGLSGGLAALLVILAALAVVNAVIGPTLRTFVRLTRRCKLDYELYLDADGALEIWRDADGVRSTEVHGFTVGATRIERVEVLGVAPAELVVMLIQPLAFGFQHSELRFPVLDGRLHEARDLARRLTPEPPEDPSEER